ncbi:cytochrome-c oxidase, cbb3-type subunit III [Arenicella xantha]|uniref:Cbb3-type cytochrome c oxidase subunit n=1 Tax=Arenicella xantha TaxID=644221 RepID=A0A395JJL1_9GAMM|nr:cytochrome-c oxidase, cbb3-type subunit III [Arenicella xantha]RBP50699.1 cytochrome c oxidase cbb3-type subunit 3 [Arenicella xantha]
MTSFWSTFIIVLAVGNILAMVWLLFATSRSNGIDESDTTGHKWDGIEELNNPLPRWWLGLFILTIIFAGVYLVLYPGLGSYEGTLSWSQQDQFIEARNENRAKQSAFFAEFADASITELAEIPKAMETGERLFANNCASCHGSAGRGAKGFPNLTDDDWLYGSSPETILASITNGRAGVMPNLNLDGSAVTVLALYVQHLAGKQDVTDFAIEKGKALFGVCMACHGPEGKGNQALGAPNLTDQVWLHGPRSSDIEHVLRHGKQGNMPSFKASLSKDEIRLLAAYVTSLSNNNEE